MNDMFNVTFRFKSKHLVLMRMLNIPNGIYNHSMSILKRSKFFAFSFSEQFDNLMEVMKCRQSNEFPIMHNSDRVISLVKFFSMY